MATPQVLVLMRVFCLATVYNSQFFDCFFFFFFFWYLGIFTADETHASMTICPRHRAEYGIRWRCSKVRCSVPAETAAHKKTSAKGDRGLGSNEAAFLLRSTGKLVQVGSRKFRVFTSVVALMFQGFKLIELSFFVFPSRAHLPAGGDFYLITLLF